MKKIKMGLFALAAFAGIGGAFAFTHKPHYSGTIYYAHKDTDGHVRWKTSQSGSCSPYSALACTITSTSNVSGVVDAFPAQYSLAGNMTTDAVYQ
jgi:uncharacterized protein YxeA